MMIKPTAAPIAMPAMPPGDREGLDEGFWVAMALWLDVVDDGVLEVVEDEVVVVVGVEEAEIVDRLEDGDERVAIEEDTVGLVAEAGYSTERLSGGGALKVSSVGLVQFVLPSGLDEQQRHN